MDVYNAIFGWELNEAEAAVFACFIFFFWHVLTDGLSLAGMTCRYVVHKLPMQ